MSKFLIAYASKEGQTRKIVTALARQLRQTGSAIDVLRLGTGDHAGEIKRYDAVVIAASVHAGKHQSAISRFVKGRETKDALAQMPSAFLSVSASAGATTEAGRKQAAEQVQTFLQDAAWTPDLVGMIGGAIRYSKFSARWRWALAVAQRLYRNSLKDLGWPTLTEDNELTNWDDLRAFGEQVHALVSQPESLAVSSH